MFRRWLLPILLILVAGIAGAWAIARNAGDPLTGLGREPGPEPAPPVPKPPKPPEREPPLLVVFGGELEGRFWVPPCSQFRQGGFARIAPVVRDVTGQAPVSLILDLGDSSGAPGASGAAEMEGILESLNDLGLAVEAVGEKDLLVGLERWNEVRGRAAKGAAVICANLRDEQGVPLVPGATPPMVAGRRKIVVAAILSPSFEKGLRDAGIPVRITDPVPALREALRIAGKADVVVLLSHADPDETRKILKEVTEVDLALAAHAGTIPWTKAEPVDGRVLYAGGAGWQFVNSVILEDGGEGKRPKLAGIFSRSVRPDIPPDLGIQMRAEIALRRMRSKGVFEASLRESAGRRAPGAAPYSGPGACATCHTAVHGKWAEDPHARSMKTVRERAFDVAWNCVSCHTTAPGIPGGHLAPGDAQAAVTCEACHGPGSAHIAAQGRVKMGSAKDSCATCHVPEMSPAFRFEEAWPLVDHGK